MICFRVSSRSNEDDSCQTGIEQIKFINLRHERCSFSQLVKWIKKEKKVFLMRFGPTAVYYLLVAILVALSH